MRIENYTTDIDINKCLINTDETMISIDYTELSEENKVIYSEFFNRFGDKKYLIKYTSGFEVTRFTLNTTSEEVKQLNYNLLPKADKSIIDNFLTLISTNHE